MAMVLVGAINVGSIETVWTGQLTPPYARVRSETRHPMDQENGAVALERGAEMGRFNMGSTVILLFGPDAIQWDAGLQPGDLVRLGQSVGSPIGPTI
jgi:phosphatidylserine decarboxylase